MMVYTEFILILFAAQVSPMGSYKANTIMAIPGFVSRAECEATIPVIQRMARGFNEVGGICIERSKDASR